MGRRLMASNVDIRELDPNAYSNSPVDLRELDPNAPPPPPTANNTPKTDAQNAFKGLAVALNSIQQKLAKTKPGFVPDVYEFEFIQPALGNAKVSKPGSTNNSRTPLVNPNSARNIVDPKVQSRNSDARNITANAGTPIVQFIDQILRNSSYITDQANVIIDETTQKPKPQQPLGDVTWFKISLEATPIKMCPVKKDFAYKIKYIISAFPIAAMDSDYFPAAKDKGVHKTYQYWFTGQNTEVIDYEVQYNTSYTVAITDPNTPLTIKQNVDTLVIAQRAYVAASGESSQGGKGRVNELGANAADFLYAAEGLGKAKLKIVGDPAWIQQGEISDKISASNFSYNPWNADDGINYDASQIVFNVTWNLPVDFDLSTGIQNPGQDQMPVSRADNKNYQGRLSAKYKPDQVQSYFSKGSFTQTITGQLISIPIPDKNVIANSQTPAIEPTNRNPVQPGSRPTNTNLAGSLLNGSEVALGFNPNPARNIPYVQASNRAGPLFTQYEGQLFPTANKPATSNGDVQSVVIAPTPSFGQNTDGRIITPQRIVKDQ